MSAETYMGHWQFFVYFHPLTIFAKKKLHHGCLTKSYTTTVWLYDSHRHIVTQNIEMSQQIIPA